jgi:putative PEP-CTERM system TPR-repeat lipoprotein
MGKMKNLLLLTAGALLMAGAAPAQEFRTEPSQFMEAKLAASEGHFDQALSLIDKVIATNPGDPVLLFERASMLLDAGKVDRGETELRKVVTLKPDFYDAQRLLGRMMLDRAGNDQTKITEALEHLRAAFRIYPDDLPTGMAISQIYLSTGRPAEAEKVLAQMLERAPDQRALNYTYAQVLTKLGRGNESKQYLERAVEIDATFGPAILQLVDIYQKENEWTKAAELLQPLIAEDPLNVDLQRQQAYFYLRAGNSEKARALFKQISEADPKDTRAKFYLAESLSDLEQYDEAQKIYRSLLEQTPDDVDVLASFGLSQVAQKKLDEASKTFHTLLNAKDLPDNLKVLANTQLAYIELQRGNYGSALEMVRPIVVFNDKPNAQAINVGLDALRKEKKYNEAIAFLQPLVDKYASDPFVNARYVEMLARAGEAQKAQQAAATQAKFGTRNVVATTEAYIQANDYPSAIALVKESLKAKPDDIDLQFALGSAYERSGDRKSAEPIFLDILKAHPDNAQTLNYLGYMWAESGVNLDKAAEMINKAVAAEPRNGAFVDSLGWVYFQKGNLELAEKYLSDAAHLLPRDATVHEHLGDVFAKRGDYSRALTLYRAALKLEPEPKDEAKLKSKIAELEKQSQSAQRR